MCKLQYSSKRYNIISKNKKKLTVLKVYTRKLKNTISLHL